MGNKKIQTVPKPIGLIGIIGPFNFPIHIPNGQIIPALLTGNTVILKCSEYAIRTTKEIAAYWKQAFNDIDSPIDFVYGDATLGKALVAHHNINAIFFTGSSAVGVTIEKECIKQRKLCALEMGGNNAIIIEDKLPHILDHLSMSAFISAGQRCTCARRIIINKKHAAIIPKWIQKIKALTVSAYPSKQAPFMGPLVLEAVKEMILRNKIPTSETLLAAKDIGPGGLITPRIELTRHHNDDEIFGPMVFIELVDSIDEAIERVNQSQYGLSTSSYTSSKKKFTHAFQHINTGIINWNTPTTGASGLAPFGGTKRSGNHKPGGFNMIDHCIIPTASNELRVPNKLTLPGTHASTNFY
jgi:succinylglutamic semialdehyde dehydrogenase